MAVCAFVPTAAVTGLCREERRKQTEPIYHRQSSCFKSDANLVRRHILLGFFTTLVAPALSSSSFASPPKILKLSISKIKEIIANDIQNGQYYVTGDLTRDIYADACRFIDPTTNIQGVDKYVDAIRLLFDPISSHHELISIEVTGPQTIQAKWRLEGYLKFPWHPYISPYEGTTLYRVNNDGLVVSHEETWDISVWQAFLQFLTPSRREV